MAPIDPVLSPLATVYVILAHALESKISPCGRLTSLLPAFDRRSTCTLSVAREGFQTTTQMLRQRMLLHALMSPYLSG